MANPNQSAMINRHIAALKSMKAKKVEAGWFESDRYGATKGSSVGVPVAKIARINEFGATIVRGKTTIIIPSRPFMRGAWLKFSNERKLVQGKIARQMIKKQITAEVALNQIGILLEGYIVKSIRDGGWQKNAKSTERKKGFNTPLIESSHMWKTVNSKVS